MDQMLEAAETWGHHRIRLQEYQRRWRRVRIDAIRKIGPERCLISEFWTQRSPRVYADLEGVGQFVDDLHARGFSDRELDMMFKDNPAKLLGLSSH